MGVSICLKQNQRKRKMAAKFVFALFLLALSALAHAEEAKTLVGLVPEAQVPEAVSKMIESVTREKRDVEEEEDVEAEERDLEKGDDEEEDEKADYDEEEEFDYDDEEEADDYLPIECWSVGNGKPCTAPNSKLVDTNGCAKRTCSSIQVCKRQTRYTLGVMSTTLMGCETASAVTTGC